MTAQLSATAAGTTLRLFDPSNASDPPPPDRVPASLTVRECYERYVLPDQRAKRAKATISGYYTTVKHWETFTDDPPVSEVTDDVVRQFAEDMDDTGQHGAHNILKQWRHLRHIFRRVARRGYGNARGLPTGEHLIEDVPYLEPLAVADRVPRVATLDELGAIYEACSVATYPKRGKVAAPLLWRTLFVVLKNCGPRTRDLFGLTWSDIHLKPECPDPRLHVSNPWGWLKFVPTKTRRSKPQPLILPLNAVTRAHLDAIRGPWKRVFPVGQSPSEWHRMRKAIQIAAGIDEPYFFKDLRVTCNTHWDRLSRGIGAHVLGHARRDVNSRHYLQVLEELCELVAELPQPEAFAQIEEAQRVRQLSLF